MMIDRVKGFVKVGATAALDFLLIFAMLSLTIQAAGMAFGLMQAICMAGAAFALSAISTRRFNRGYNEGYSLGRRSGILEGTLEERDRISLILTSIAKEKPRSGSKGRGRSHARKSP